MLVASVFPVSPEWSFSGFFSVFQLCKLTPVLVAPQCTCGSSGLPVCCNYANYYWIATGRPLDDSISQCGSSVVSPVVSQCTDSIWFGSQQVRSLPSMQPLIYTTGMAKVVWFKWVLLNCNSKYTNIIMVLISKACNEWCGITHTFEELNRYALQSSNLQIEAELTEACPFAAWCPTISSFQTGIDACFSAKLYVPRCVRAVIVSPVVFQCRPQ